MTDDQMDDLKQYIAGVVSQTEARLTDRIDGLDYRVGNLEQNVGGLERRMGSLEQKVDDGFAGIAEALEQMQEDQDEKNRLVHKRLACLKGQAV